MDSKTVLRLLQADGWRIMAQRGSHVHLKHPIKPGRFTVPHPVKDLHPKTLASIKRQSNLKF